MIGTEKLNWRERLLKDILNQLKRYVVYNAALEQLWPNVCRNIIAFTYSTKKVFLSQKPIKTQIFQNQAVHSTIQDKANTIRRKDIKTRRIFYHALGVAGFLNREIKSTDLYSHANYKQTLLEFSIRDFFLDIALPPASSTVPHHHAANANNAPISYAPKRLY